MVERVQNWIEHGKITVPLICHSLTDKDEGIEIVLYPNLGSFNDVEEVLFKKIVVFFDSVIAYRNISESFYLKAFDKYCCRKSPLFIVKNSEWIKWLVEESYGVLESGKIVHYSIYSENDCIELLSETTPLVSFFSDF